MSDKKNQLSTVESKEMIYEVNGEEIKLTGGIVKKFLARGNKEMTDAEIFMFMSLCKFQKLNPFLNEAYPIKFGDDCQLIVGKEAYMKRAESSNLLEGHEAGIIIERDGKILEVEGCFLLPNDKLIGGWAKVYRSDRKYPTVMKVSFKEYDKGQSIWKTKPSTMIRKVALVQALREAFPENLSGMYVEDELPEIDIEKKVKSTIRNNANGEIIDIEDEQDDVLHEEVVIEEVPEDKPKKANQAPLQQEIVIDEEPEY